MGASSLGRAVRGRICANNRAFPMPPLGLSFDLTRLLRRLRDCDIATTEFTHRAATVILIVRGWQSNAMLDNATLGGNLPARVENTCRGQRWIIGWTDSNSAIPSDALERFCYFGNFLVWWLAEERRLARGDADRLLRRWKGVSLACRRKQLLRRRRIKR